MYKEAYRCIVTIT